MKDGSEELYVEYVMSGRENLYDFDEYCAIIERVGSIERFELGYIDKTSDERINDTELELRLFKRLLFQS